MAGNANSGNRHKDRPFRDALMIAIKERTEADDRRGLRKIAENLLDLAEKSEATAIAAITALADRLDGKPSQQVDIGNPEGEEFKVRTTIERIITDPANPNSAGVSTSSETKSI